MRKISLVLLFLVAVGSVHVTAEPNRTDRGDRAVHARITRTIKKVLRIVTNFDGLTPPVPSTPPPPRP